MILITDIFADVNVVLFWLLLALWLAVLIAIPLTVCRITKKILDDIEERDRLDGYYYTSKEFMKRELGNTVLISAERGTRGGKTMTMCGMLHAYTDIIMENCQDSINWFKSVFIELDYSLFDQVLQDCYNSGSSVLATAGTLKNLAPTADYFVGVYDDYINRRDRFGLLFDYVECYYSLLEFDPTFANIHFHNRITGKDSRMIGETDFDLKNVYKNHSYILRPHIAYGFDEATIGDRQSQRSQIVDKADTGRDVFYKLFPQSLKETSYLVTTSQRASRVVKVDRELYNSFVDIRHFEIKGVLPYAEKLIRRLKSLNGFLSRIVRFLRFNEVKRYMYDQCFNWSKARTRALDDIISYFKSGAYLVISANVCHKAEWVEKDPDEIHSVMFDFVFPIRYCFGVYDTHYYKFLHYYLADISEEDPINRPRLGASVSLKEAGEKTKDILKKMNSDEKDVAESEDY